MYAANWDLPLRVYDETGAHRANARTGAERGPDTTFRFVPHPSGEGVLVLANGWVAYAAFAP